MTLKEDLLMIGTITLVVCCFNALFYMFLIENELFIKTSFDVECEIDNTPVNGYYKGSQGFFVLTNGRSPKDIAETTFHELAHYYEDQDHYHFCEEYN